VRGNPTRKVVARAKPVAISKRFLASLGMTPRFRLLRLCLAMTVLYRCIWEGKIW